MIFRYSNGALEFWVVPDVGASGFRDGYTERASMESY